MDPNRASKRSQMREHPNSPTASRRLAAVRASLPSSPHSQTANPQALKRQTIAPPRGAALISPPRTPRQHPIHTGIGLLTPTPLLRDAGCGIVTGRPI
jgi:hypothetical protein